MNSWTRRIAVIAAVVALGSLISMAPASARPITISANPDPVAQGGTLTVSGEADCITGSTLSIHVEMGLNALTPQSVSGDAAWQVTFSVPANAALGSYTVNVEGNECTFDIIGVEITAAAVTTTTTVAPTTTLAPTTTAAPAKTAAVAVAATPAFTG
jgi:hypothetical protein